MTDREKEIFIRAYNSAIGLARTQAIVDSNGSDSEEASKYLDVFARMIIHDMIKDIKSDWPVCDKDECCLPLWHEFDDIEHE